MVAPSRRYRRCQFLRLAGKTLRVLSPPFLSLHDAAELSLFFLFVACTCIRSCSLSFSRTVPLSVVFFSRCRGCQSRSPRRNIANAPISCLAPSLCRKNSASFTSLLYTGNCFFLYFLPVHLHPFPFSSACGVVSFPRLRRVNCVGKRRDIRLLLLEGCCCCRNEVPASVASLEALRRGPTVSFCYVFSGISSPLSSLYKEIRLFAAAAASRSSAAL